MQRFVDLGFKEPARGGLMRVFYGRGGKDEKGTGEYRIIWGREGAAACQRALADPRLGGWWMRRGSLLRAEAVHYIAAGDVAEAEPILTRLQAEAAASTNGLYRSSIASSVALIRAWLSLKAGRRDDALKFANQLSSERPYAAFITRASARIHFAAEPGWATVDRVSRQAASVDPSQIEKLLIAAALVGDFSRVVELDREIEVTSPSQRNDWTYDAGVIEEGVKLAYFAGHAAYALAALDRPTEAEARLNRGDEQLSLFAERVKKTAFGASPSERNLRQSVANLARAELGRWRKMIEVRRTASGIGMEQLATRTKGSVPRDFNYFTDMRQVALAGRPEAGAQGVANPLGKDELANALRTLDVDDLTSSLTDIEFESGQLKISNAENWLLSMTHGLTFKNEANGALTVRYGMGGLGPATVQEFAMLGAARKIRSTGYSAFIVLNEQTLPRVIEDCTRGLVCARNLIGYEAQLLILPVNPAQVPPGYQQFAWRALDAAKVQGSIESHYALSFAPRSSGS